MPKEPSVPMGEVWGEFLEFARAFGGVEFSMALSQQLGLEGLAVLRYRAHRRCPVAAKELANRGLGQPTLPIEMRTQTMTEAECLEGMRADFLTLKIDGKPIDPQLVGKLIEAMASTDRGDDDA